MKKIITIMICMVFTFSNLVFAEELYETTSVTDEIWLSQEKDSSVLQNIKNINEQKIEETISQYLLAPGYAREKIGISSDDEIMKKQVMEHYRVDANNILKVYSMKNRDYAEQYAIKNSLRYLISDDYYWMEITEDKDLRYNSDGSEYDYSNDDFSTFGMKTITHEMIELLKDEEKVISLLVGVNITTIQSLKIIALNQATTCLYVDCGSEEYLVALYIGVGNKYIDGFYVSSEWIKNIEPLKLYTAKEFLQIISEEANVMSSTKQTFETEALKLQENGLLYGNENGLDLLKPLTRIEAATMLLRALGESTTNETTVQTFADVPATHWGYGAAENAYSLGLIKGVGDDMFAPDDIVTGPQFATMILRAGNHVDFNWEEALDILIDEGVISAEDASTMDFFTRGDMAKIIYEAIEHDIF